MAEIMSSCGEGARALHWCVCLGCDLPQVKNLIPSSTSSEMQTCVVFRHCCMLFSFFGNSWVLCPQTLLAVALLAQFSVPCGSCLLLQWDSTSALFFHFSHFNSACTLLPLPLKCCRPAHFPFGLVEPSVRGLVSLQGCCNILGALQHFPSSSLFLSK